MTQIVGKLGFQREECEQLEQDRVKTLVIHGPETTGAQPGGVCCGYRVKLSRSKGRELGLPTNLPHCAGWSQGCGTDQVSAEGTGGGSRKTKWTASPGMRVAAG